MTQTSQPRRPVDDSNERLGRFMAGIPDAPAAKPEGRPVPWGLFASAAATAVALAAAVYWTMIR